MKRLARAAEGSARILALIKLANVGLVMIWGFAVTFVFVRILPVSEFQAFLLLVAFGNFTISAEFGLTSIIYARLRKYWLGSDRDNDASFRLEELGILFLFLGGLILGGIAILVVAWAMGWAQTSLPLLFLLFFLTACLNLPALLAKRALAAIDRNFLWEILDCGRRVITIALLLAMLLGMDARLSVTLQLLVSLFVIAYAIFYVHRQLGMTISQWIALRSGGGHVRRHYLRDIGASALFTASDMIAYNAPYFTIALVSHDVRPMLLFDFFFKMSRALSMLVRATVEAALPRITRAYHSHEVLRLRQLITRALVVAIGFSAILSIALWLLGPWIFTTLFDGRAEIYRSDIMIINLALVALAVLSVSVYVHAALGRFILLLRRSLPLMFGSLASVAVAWLFWPKAFDTAFLTLYAATFLFAAVLHAAALRKLIRL